MLKKISLAVLALVVLFLGYVATRNGDFHYERSGLINAKPEKIFSYVSNLKMGSLWSPYEKADPDMKKTFTGPDGQVGAVLEFEGNSQTGSGKLEVLKLVPNESVDIKLTMTKPIYGENLVHYQLIPEGDGTRFVWSLSGKSGFMGKLFSVLLDCEKMVGAQFDAGIANLKSIVEASNSDNTKESKMNLTEKPDTVTWATTHYIYTEKIGPFMETARKAWEECHHVKDELAKNAKITGAFAQYKMQPQMVYRAGFKVEAKPAKIPDGFKYAQIDGGKYARFVLKGSYANLPQASGRVHEIIATTKLPLRDDFFIENYANDPSTTPEDQLITEIMAPTK